MGVLGAAAPPHRLSLIVWGNLRPLGCAGVPGRGGGVAVVIPILPLGKLSSGLAGLLWELLQNCDQKLGSLNL